MESKSDRCDPVARGTSLVQLFCSPEEFGVLRGIPPAEVPEPDRTLLDHRSHMTVAMERFHDGLVQLRVVAKASDQLVSGAAHRDWYAREILLENSRGELVQYGIVRIDLTHLDAATAEAIRAARRPLGRILIEAGMLREVNGVKLLEVLPGPHLLTLLGSGAAGSAAVAPLRRLYGRVADIQLDGRPAVELLEIVVPTHETRRTDQAAGVSGGR